MLVRTPHLLPTSLILPIFLVICKQLSRLNLRQLLSLFSSYLARLLPTESGNQNYKFMHLDQQPDRNSLPTIQGNDGRQIEIMSRKFP